ncbi:SWIB/MDM2 domain-containing protein [Parasitella parasitica]|nr:SWIB/MDM2 domain-containing protein [Parasitella parasitica]
MNKKRKSTTNSADLLEDHLLHQQVGGAIQKKKTKAKKKKTPKIVDPNAPPKPKRKTGLNKPLILSPALSELMDGEKELSRPELVQKLWKYIKDNDLQDPADRRFILCDDKLKKIFDQDRINSFGMNKDLSAHLTKKEEPAIKQEPDSIEQQTDTAVYTETDQDNKNLNTASSATATTSTTISTTATEDVATMAVASNENTNTTPLLLQQEATPSEDAIVTPKEEEFLLNL